MDVTVAVRFMENEGEVFIPADIEKSGIMGARAALCAASCVALLPCPPPRRCGSSRSAPSAPPRLSDAPPFPPAAGFCDVCPEEPKRLRVRYRHRGRLHEVRVGGGCWFASAAAAPAAPPRERGAVPPSRALRIHWWRAPPSLARR